MKMQELLQEIRLLSEINGGAINKYNHDRLDNMLYEFFYEESDDLIESLGWHYLDDRKFIHPELNLLCYSCYINRSYGFIMFDRISYLDSCDSTINQYKLDIQMQENIIERLKQAYGN